MNTNKTKKIFLLVALFAAAIICFVCAGAFVTRAFADEVKGDRDNTAYYFNNAGVAFENDEMTVSLTANSAAAFKRELDVSDFSIDFTSAEDYGVLKVKLLYASKNSYEKTVEDVITLSDYNSGSVKVSLNGDEPVDVSVSTGYGIKIASGVITLNGTSLGSVNANAQVYPDGNVYATLSFLSTKDAAVKISQINGQTFVFDETTRNFKVKEAGNVKINYEFYHEVGENNVKIYSYSNVYTLTAKYAGVAYDSTLTSITVKNSTAKEYTVSSNKIVFHKLGNVEVEFSNGYKETVLVVTDEADTTAPVYDAAKFDAWKEQVKVAFEAQKGGLYKNEKLTLPSLIDVVKDDVYDYSLLSYVLHYTTENNEDLTVSGKTNGDITLTIKEEGNYHCYIVFSDGKTDNPNSMDKDDVKANYSFTIEGVSYLKVPSVKASAATVIPGYVDTTYSANSFTIKGADETTYTLWYKAKATDEPVQVYAKGDDNYDKDNGICIDYAGGLTFTPKKLGIYTIKCTARLNEPGVSDYATDNLDINVIAKPKIVKTPTELTRNNILSIVFLCIGVAALIGLVCVIFIKPKTKANED